jgi:flagellar hook-associated protein 2
MSSTSSINPLLSSPSTNPALDLSSILAAETGATSTGIDVNSAVAAALYADRAPERIWQADQTTLSSQSTALTNIQSATESLYTDLQNLNVLGGPLAARTVSSSLSGYVTGSATTSAATGTHTVVVNHLATQGSWYSDLSSSATATLPSSAMTITMASGASATFQLGSGTSGDNLQDLASAINGAKLGVTANVVTDSSGSRLSIMSNSTGTAADFTVTSQNYTGTAWTSPDMPTGSSLGADSLTITGSNGATLTVQTTSGETYSQFAADINSKVAAYNQTATTPLAVTAAAGSDANGTNLSITSTDGSSFTLNQPSFGFTQAAAGADASATVDGVPVTSATNTLTGAVAGVTINLLGATQGSAVTLNVQADTTQASNALSQLVTDYNNAINLVNAQFKMATATDSSGNASTSQGVLAGDSTIRSLQSALEQAISYVYTPPTGTTTVSNLADVGITMNNDGTLSFDSSKLSTALSNNASDVQNFFQGTALNGFANNFYSALGSYTSPADGAFQVDLRSIQAQNTSLSQQISDFESGYIANQQTVLMAEFSSAEEALQALPQQMAQLNSMLGFNSKGN